MIQPEPTVASIGKPLRRADLAELFGVTLRTIDNRRKAGELPPSFTCGNERLWRPQDVEAWMVERVEKELAANGCDEGAAPATCDQTNRGVGAGLNLSSFGRSERACSS